MTHLDAIPVTEWQERLDARQKAELILDMCDDRNEARRHLRQLLHALDNEIGMGDKPPARSVNVALAMVEARRYLQGAAGTEQ